MKVDDELYGQAELEEVLIELIHTKAVQRLKHIHQAGAAHLVNKAWNVTRYEHSIGVMLLIRKLGGTLEEQLAGLLHDVSHTAFSHAVDFAFEIMEQNYHEQLFESVVMNSDIPRVAAKHSIDIASILASDRWSILEQALPKLCADRIDYTLRDLYRYFGLPKAEIDSFLHSLIIVQGEICVSSLDMAEWFTKAYYRLVIDFFLSPLNVYSYHVLAQLIRLALAKGILHPDQLLLDDRTVLALLQSSDDRDIWQLLDRLSDVGELEENEADYDFQLVGKTRTIDVPVSFDGKTIQHASSLSPAIKAMNAEALQKSRKGTFVKRL